MLRNMYGSLGCRREGADVIVAVVYKPGLSKKRDDGWKRRVSSKTPTRRDSDHVLERTTGAIKVTDFMI